MTLPTFYKILTMLNMVFGHIYCPGGYHLRLESFNSQMCFVHMRGSFSVPTFLLRSCQLLFIASVAPTPENALLP